MNGKKWNKRLNKVILGLSFFCMLIIVGVFTLPIVTNQSLPLENVVKVKVVGTEINWYTGEPDDWQGSGIFIRDDLILTAGHIVDDANSITVILQNGEEYFGSDWYKETSTDVGFIRVFTPEKEPKLRFVDATLGDESWIIGYPVGESIALTKGIVVSTNWLGFLFVDASSWPGNSGSPVLDEDGYIIGILVAGPYEWESMSLCIPSKIINLSLEKYLATKSLERVE